MRYLVLLLLLTPCALAATQKSFTNATNYTFEEKSYIIYTIDKDYILLGQNNRTSVLHKDECLQSSLTRTCLKSATAESAEFEEKFLGPVLKAKQETKTKTAERGTPVTATITIENTGEQTARNVAVTVNLPEGLELDRKTDKQQYTWSGRVDDETVLTYDVIARTNKTFAWNGTVRYNDGNTTKTLNLTDLTLTSTSPITYAIRYEANTTQTPTPFNITVTRKTQTNYTFTITSEFPPETTFNSTTRGAVTKGTTITYRKQPNTTTFSFNALYSFRSQPTTPLVVTIAYENTTDEYNYTETLAFSSPEDTPPALAVGASELTAGEPSALTVTITGNRTGWLFMNSTPYRLIKELESGTYTFPLAITEPGNYTLDVSFQSKSLYGDEEIAAGQVQLVVHAQAPAVEKEPEPQAPPQTQQEQPPTPQTTPKPQNHSWTLIVLALASTGLLAVLLVLVRAVRDPLHRIEKLTERTAQLRVALQKKKKAGTATQQEEALLASLETQLRELEKKL